MIQQGNTSNTLTHRVYRTFSPRRPGAPELPPLGRGAAGVAAEPRPESRGQARPVPARTHRRGRQPGGEELQSR